MGLLDFVNYDNCITNLTSSIQKHYKLTPNYKTNELIDSLLAEKDYDNVIVFVFDAMGNSIIDKNTTENHFLQKRRVGKMQSTYPPTTANCTTAYITGLNPITTGWLGWSTYFKDIDLGVDNFPNANTVTKEIIPGDNIARIKLPIKDLGEIIEEETNHEITYHKVMPSFDPNGCVSLKEFEHRIIKLCNQKGKKYIYAYWTEPDSTMHKEGTKNDHVKKILNQIGKLLHKVERKTKNTIGIISADHSQVDVVPIALYTYYDFLDCLKAPISCDSRTPFFFVKEGKEEQFIELFNKYFADKFELFAKQQVIDMHLFGYGKENPLFKDIIGDYVGVAKDKYYFMTIPDYHLFNGHHAGGLFEESDIPIIIFKN